MTTYDPGIWKMLSWLEVLGLGVAARLLPGPRLVTTSMQPARPRRFWLTGFIGVFGQFVIVYNGADNGVYPFPVTMILAAGLRSAAFRAAPALVRKIHRLG